MRTFRQFTVFLTVFLLIVALAACGPSPGTEPSAEPTSGTTADPASGTTAEPTLAKEWIVMNMDNAMSQYTPTSYKMSFSVSMELLEEEAVLKYGYGLESEIITSHNPLQSFNSTVMTVTAPDHENTFTVQEHCVEEDGIVISYFKDAASPSWIRTDTGIRVLDYLAGGYASISTSEVWPGFFAFDSWSMEPDKAKVDETEVYVLHTTLPMSTFESVLSAFALSGNEDLTAQRIPITYYADSESYSVIRMVVDLSPVSQRICGILAADLLQVPDDQLAHQTAELVYELDYGAQTVPPLPPSVLESEELKVLEWGSDSVLVTAPEGWTVSRTDAHSATINSKEVSALVTYSDMSEEAFRAEIDAEVEHLDDLSLYRSHNTMESIDGYEIIEIRTRGTTYYHAWKELGDGAVYLHISDYAFDGDAQELLTLLTGCIALYTE